MTAQNSMNQAWKYKGARLKFWACLIVSVLLLLFSKCANAAITDLKLSTAQIFDVQWYVSGSTLYASGFNYIYASVNYATQTTSAARWTAAQTSDANSNGRYITFVDSPTVSGTYGMVVKNSDGSIYKWINYTGSFRALADGAIFYNGNGMWGTLITTGAGYSNGQSGNWTITANYPTNTQLASYTPPSSTPLAAGQTAGSGSSSPTVVSTSTSNSVSSSSSTGATTTTNNSVTFLGGTYTVTGTATPTTTTTTTTPVTTTTYSDGSTTTSNGSSTTTSSTTWSYTVTGPGSVPTSPNSDNRNSVYITQNNAGSANGVQVNQSGHGNYTVIEFSDSNNNINVGQGYTFNSNATIATESQTASNFNVFGLELTGSSNTVTNTQVGLSNSSIINVSGNTNTDTVNQTGNNNQSYGLISGNTNTSSVTQSGNSNLASINLYGNGNNGSVSQTGNSHGALLNLVNAGGPNTVSLVQTGTGDAYSLQQTCTNPAGCSASVVRNR